jgi:hypothetical protein
VLAIIASKARVGTGTTLDAFVRLLPGPCLFHVQISFDHPVFAHLNV